MKILISVSDTFDDYDFFIWGMFVTFEEFKENNDEFVLYPRGVASKYALEFSNKIGESMKKRGYKVKTQPFTVEAYVDTDYWVHFMHNGETAPRSANKVYTM